MSFESMTGGPRDTEPVLLRQLANQQNVAIRIMNAEFARGHVERVGDLEDNQLVAVRAGLPVIGSSIMQAFREEACSQACNVGALHIEQDGLPIGGDLTARDGQHEPRFA